MGTSCRIGILYRYSQKIKSVYVHWDGYPKGVGQVLLNYYNDPDSIENLQKIQHLIDKADLRYLESDQCLEHFPSCESTIYKEDTSYLDYFYRTLDSSSEYYYLYEHGVGWSCGSTTSGTPITGFLVNLKNAIQLMDEYENNQCITNENNVSKELIHFSESDT
jgi:hypothetical protein